MRTLEQYLALVTSEHRDKPKYSATLSTVLAPFADLQAFLATVPPAFDLDVAVGAQLDVVGQWVGSNRLIPEPLPNLWFSFDTPGKGFDEGYWKGPYNVGELLERLDDDTFRRLIRAKILSNNWQGTIPEVQATLNEFFIDPATTIMVLDNAGIAQTNVWFSFDDPVRGFEQGIWFEPGGTVATLPELDMSVTIGIAGKIPSIVDLEIFARGLIPLNIGGVQQEVSVTSVDRNALFGFDIENAYIRGFDDGAWGVSPQYMIDQLT